jgi:hypothetical protein
MKKVIALTKLKELHKTRRDKGDGFDIITIAAGSSSDSMN